MISLGPKGIRYTWTLGDSGLEKSLSTEARSVVSPESLRMSMNAP